MSLQHGILGFLNYEKMSGYDLAKAFNTSVHFFWYAQNSQIYLTLDMLEKKGLVTHELIVQTDKPNKKLYSITKAGREEFICWLSAKGGAFTNEFKSAFLMKIFFSGNRTPEESKAMLQTFAEDCRSYLDKMRTIPDAIVEYGQETSPYTTLYWQFTADFGYSYMKMCIEWAENCIEKLEALA